MHHTSQISSLPRRDRLGDVAVPDPHSVGVRRAAAHHGRHQHRAATPRRPGGPGRRRYVPPPRPSWWRSCIRCRSPRSRSPADQVGVDPQVREHLLPQAAAAAESWPPQRAGVVAPGEQGGKAPRGECPPARGRSLRCPVRRAAWTGSCVPPDAPSTWWKRSPACSSAARTPAWYATRIPPPARTRERRGPAGPPLSRGANGDDTVAITPVDRAAQRAGRVPGGDHRCSAGWPSRRPAHDGGGNQAWDSPRSTTLPGLQARSRVGSSKARNHPS